MVCSGTSVLSTRRRRGAKPLAVAAAAFEKTLRRFGVLNARCCGSLCRANIVLQHFDFAGLEGLEGLNFDNIKPQKFISFSRLLPPSEGAR